MKSLGPAVSEGPYHAGELAVQARADVRDLAAATGRMIADRITPGAWSFLERQPLLALGTWDGGRDARATVLLGPPGMAQTSDGRTVRLDLRNALVDRADPAWHNLQRSGVASLLAIELSTRRRLRVNGSVRLEEADPTNAPFELDVAQAYPNCPKYIQRREQSAAPTDEPAGAVAVESVGDRLSADQARLASSVDTFFVATVHPVSGTDVSHRGGRPGFIQVESDTRLRIPDYIGNNMFNTLGNIDASGIAGVTLVDFEGGRLLQLAGDAAIDWRPCGLAAERSWTLDIREARQSRLPRLSAWRLVDASPFCP